MDSDKSGSHIIKGLLLNMPEEHHQLDNPTPHIVAMGRFSVASEDNGLKLKTDLFGQHANEQRFKISITNGKFKEEVFLTKAHPNHSLFSQQKYNQVIFKYIFVKICRV